ncbi:hypothetical protein Tco_0894987 [Tanacetum coccineum]|uniref:Meiosis-specific nuclear structural protein 1 n=1 Tax=Tanacetum coccineum TaxID=301880 RepID=A0ABQ5CDC4_9ASTR
MVTNLQKQMEVQALEAQRREEEREKLAEEREKRAEERVKSMVINIHKQVEYQALEAEFREQEIESRAEIRAHAIIWDIERQRYFYEQEQRNLRMAWNQDILTKPKAMKYQRHFSFFMATYMAEAARYRQV